MRRKRSGARIEPVMHGDALGYMFVAGGKRERSDAGAIGAAEAHQAYDTRRLKKVGSVRGGTSTPRIAPYIPVACDDAHVLLP